MSYTNGLDKPNEYFNTVLYNGQATAISVTGVGFKPDFVWVKRRDTSANNRVGDIVRGTGNYLQTNTTDAEGSTDIFTSFDSDGFSHGTGASFNTSGATYASWNWLAGGTASSNTDGSITSQVSANTTSGFSIVSYTGNGTGGATVGHSLGSTPQVVLIKNRDQPDVWIFAGEIGSLSYGTNYLRLNGTNALIATSNQVTSASSSTFTLGTGGAVNTNTEDYIAYCFAEKKGFSKFGSYTGNGSTDGTFVYTGFKPAFLLVKRTNSTGNWPLYNNKSQTFNQMDKQLYPNLSNAEGTSGTKIFDFLSNGFKARGNATDTNASGSTYIYMAFAENPFVTSTGIPATAR